MNFLAHIYLSGTSNELVVGNFIGDYVKGNKYNNYPDKIKEGILLHRHIDDFTDSNLIVRKSKSHFQDSYGKYAGIVVDILYDHFLSNNWKKYCDITLDEFTTKLIQTLQNFVHIFPQAVKNFFPSFVNNNWLGKYISLSGIEGVLNGMSRKTSLPQETENAMRTLIKKYDEIEDEFNAYFPEIMDFVERTHDVHLATYRNKQHMPAIISKVAS